ncbi:Hypothetical predicted protein [Lecanosticta acicola]|uniref:Uncharacterized protein n=1 Tax=Lecanosticta acicola TaxID=111012 RepID=A0AAI8Z242_9PEZI|nr:Hypothetical predicted protein [Lecanosticta acicola]
MRVSSVSIWACALLAKAAHGASVADFVEQGIGAITVGANSTLNSTVTTSSPSSIVTSFALGNEGNATVSCGYAPYTSSNLEPAESWYQMLMALLHSFLKNLKLGPSTLCTARHTPPLSSPMAWK